MPNHVEGSNESVTHLIAPCSFLALARISRVSITRVILNRSDGGLTSVSTRIFEELLVPATPKCVEFLSAAPAGTITEADSWRHARRHPRFFLANLRAHTDALTHTSVVHTYRMEYVCVWFSLSFSLSLTPPPSLSLSPYPPSASNNPNSQVSPA